MDSPVGDRDFWAVPGRVERLRELWAAGESQTAVALALGTSRSAIGGKLQRLKIQRGGRISLSCEERLRRNAERRRLARALAREAGVAPRWKKPLDGLPWPNAGPSVADLRLPDAPPVAFADLGDRSCRWPVGGLFCGADGYPWCPYHQDAAVRGGQKQETSEWQKNEPPAGVANAPAPTHRALKRSPRTGGWVTIPGRG